MAKKNPLYNPQEKLLAETEKLNKKAKETKNYKFDVKNNPDYLKEGAKRRQTNGSGNKAVKFVPGGNIVTPDRAIGKEKTKSDSLSTTQNRFDASPFNRMIVAQMMKKTVETGKSFDEIISDAMAAREKRENEKNDVFNTPAGKVLKKYGLSSVEDVHNWARNATNRMLYDPNLNELEREGLKKEVDLALDMKEIARKKVEEENRSLFFASKDKLESIANDPNFDVYAAKGEMLGGEKKGKGNIDIARKNMVSYLRNNPEKFKFYEDNSTDNALQYDLEYKAAKYADNGQIKVYNAYLGMGDKKAAQDYLKSIENELNEKMGKDISQDKDNAFKKLVFSATAGSDQFAQGLIGSFNDSDYYIPPSAIQHASSIVREKIKSPVLKTFYDLGVTTSNMLPSIAASTAVGFVNPIAGTAVGVGLMGVSAKGNSYREKLNSGWDKDKARFYSAAVGIAEAGMQYLLGGVGKLGGAVSGKSIKAISEGINNAIGKFAFTLGGKMVSEGLEESLQEVISPFLENLALGYTENDLSDIEWGQVAYSGMLGALSAGLLEGGSVYSDTVLADKKAKAKNKKITFEDIVNYGKGEDVRFLVSDDFDKVLKNKPEGDTINKNELSSGGKINGSENTEALGEGRIGRSNDSVWQQRNDSEASYERLGGSAGDSRIGPESGRGLIPWSGRLQLDGLSASRKKKRAFSILREISERRVSDVDSEKRNISDEAKDYFKRTVVKNEQGELIPLFHATDNEFNVFEYGDFGFHLGSSEQAITRGGRFIKEVYANITNPMYISEDKGIWPSLVVANEALSQGIISEKEYNIISKMDGFYEKRYDSPANKSLRNLLKARDYDGIVYNNGHEGEGLSFIAFDPEQIKYVSNESPTRNPDLRYSIYDGNSASSANKVLTPEEEARIDEVSGHAGDLIEKLGFTVTDVPHVQNMPDNVDGYVDFGRREVYVNPNTKNRKDIIFKHEITHILERSKGSRYVEGLKGYVKSNMSAQWDMAYKKNEAKYAKIKVQDSSFKVTDSLIESETLADFAMFLSTDSAIEYYANNKPGFAKSIRDFFKYVSLQIKRFTGNFSEQNQADLIALKWEKALSKAVKNESGLNGSVNKNNNVQFVIDEKFEERYDKWIAEGRPDRQVITVGRTSDALRSIDVKEQKITWDTSRINYALNKHKYLDTDILRQIPDLIERPIIVMQSKQADSRITMFGEVYDSDGLPVMVVLELMPVNRKGTATLDVMKVVSTHSRKSKNKNKPADITQTQGMINSSDILYVEPDKKRTDNWLSLNRLQLPLSVTNYGPIKRVTYPDGFVKNNYMQEFGKDAGGEVLYSVSDGRSVSEIIAELEEVDRLLENESLSDEEYRRLDRQSRKLERELTVATARRSAAETQQTENNVTAESARTPRFSENRLSEVAGHIRRISRSLYSKNKLISGIEKIYGSIAQGNAEKDSVFAECYSLAEKVLAEAKPVTESNDYVKGILKDIRGQKISLSESQIEELKEVFDENYRNAFMGKIIISKDGLPIEEAWQRWSEAYPEYFDAEISDGDMAPKLLEVYNFLRAGSEVEVLEDASQKAQWLANEIYEQYFKVSPDKSGEHNADSLRDAVSDYREYGETSGIPSRQSAKQSQKYYTDRLSEVSREIAVIDEELSSGELTPDEIEIAQERRDMLSARRRQFAEKTNVLNEVLEILDDIDTAARPNHTWVNDISHDLHDKKNVLKYGTYGFNDFERNVKRFFGKKYFSLAYEKILKPLFCSKENYADYIEHYSDRIYNEVVKGLGIKKGSKESAAVMWLGEGERPISNKEGSDMTKYTFEDCVAEFGKEKAENIKKAVSIFRECYDEMIDGINATRQALYPNNPDKLVPKRKDYFRHFQEVSNSLKGLKKAMGVNQGIDPLLVGVSETTTPKSKWQSMAQERTGKRTDYDAVGGFLDYLTQAAYSTHIDPNIVNIRSLAYDLASAKAKEGANGNPDANGFIRYLQKYANKLAGKTTSHFDRAIGDSTLGRPFMAALTWFNNRAKANAVLGNFSSMLSQFANITNAAGMIKNQSDLVKGAKDALLGLFGNKRVQDNYSRSGFLKERFISKKLERFERPGLGKLAAEALGVADEIGTRITWNAAFNEAVRLNEPDPFAYADSLTRACVAGRGIGEVPLNFESQFGKLFLPFRIEVNNNVNVYQDILFQNENNKGKHTKAYATKQILKIFIASAVINGLMRGLKGDDFNPLEDLFGGDDEEEKRSFLDRMKALGIDYVDDGDGVVFDPMHDIASGVYQGVTENKDADIWEKAGLSALRPVQNIAGDFISNHPLGTTAVGMMGVDNDTASKIFNDSLYISPGVGSPVASSVSGAVRRGANGELLSAGVEIAKPFLLPFGGSQVDKSVRGIYEYAKGSSTTKRPYERMTGKEGNLKYLIEPNAENAVKSALFGPTAFSDASDEYYNGKYKLDEKESAEVMKLKGYGERKTLFDEIIAGKEYRSQDEKSSRMNEAMESFKADAGNDSEIVMLYEGGVGDAAPYRNVPTSLKFTFNDKSYSLDLSAKDAEKISSELSEAISERYYEIDGSDKFKAMTDEEKEKFLSSVSGLEFERAKAEVFYSNKKMSKAEFNDYMYSYNRRATAQDRKLFVDDVQVFNEAQAANTAEQYVKYIGDGRVTDEVVRQVDKYTEYATYREASDVDRELMRLSNVKRSENADADDINASGNASGVLSFTKDKVDYYINIPEDKTYEVMALVDDSCRSVLEKLFSSSAYKKAQDNLRVDMIAKVKRNARAKVKESLKAKFGVIKVDDFEKIMNMK